ncbi:MAG: FecR family protein [Bacteroidota bacterium]
MNTYQDDTFLARWLSGDLTEEERKEFEASEDYAELTRVLKGIDQLKPAPMNSIGMLSGIKHQIEQQKKKKVIPFGSWAIAIAAGIALLITLWVVTRPQLGMVEEIAERGVEHKIINKSFPDGSVFSLNVDSKLSYDAELWDDVRKVSLEGEAYFEVKKGRTFEVQSPQGNIRVLGTKFNVFARANSLQVICYEGRVEVSYQGKIKTLVDTVEAGQFIEQDLGNLRIKSEKPKPISELAYDSHWRKDVTYFEGEFSFKDIKDELERLFDLHVVTQANVEADSLERISGYEFIRHNDPSEKEFKRIFERFGLKARYSKNPQTGKGQILISRP